MSDLSRSWLWVLIVIPVGALAVAGNLGMAEWIGQAGTQIPIPTGQVGALEHSRMSDDEPYASRELQERQMKRLRQEHQNELIDDTARLVKLATALKAEVDEGTQPTTLPTDALKQADEITKLAKRVSERIKTQ